MGLVAAGTSLLAAVIRFIMSPAKETLPPLGPKASLKVHPQTGPGAPPVIGPPVQAKQSVKIEASTQVGPGGGGGVGLGAGGVTTGPPTDRPEAGPPSGEEIEPAKCVGVVRAAMKCFGVGGGQVTRGNWPGGRETMHLLGGFGFFPFISDS